MSNWIKVDVFTPWKRAMGVVMDRCNCDRAHAFLAWFTLWTWFDSVSADGVLSVTRDELDERAHLPGIASALEEVGWLRWQGSTCYVANWYEHNGSSAKARSLTARRVSAFRKRRQSPPPPTRSPKT